MSRMSGDPCYGLICAVRSGDVVNAKVLIDTYGLSHFQAWSAGYNLLRDALQHEHPEVTKLLLESGSKVNSKNKRPSETPLHFAVKSGYKDIVSMLLARDAYVNAIDHSCETPLHCAVDRGYSEIVKLLIEGKASIDARSSHGMTALHHAVQKGNLEIANDLLNHGARVNASMTSSWKSGYSPLHCAASLGNESLVKLLISKGANINARTQDKQTPLHIATDMKRDKIVKLLLEKGANIEARDKNGKSILHVAVERVHLPTIEHILSYRPNINSEANRNGLHAAITGPPGEKLQKILEVLLHHGFTVSQADAKNAKLLHAAVERGYIEIVEALFKLGADVNAQHIGKAGTTLLHTAALYRRLDMISLLLRNGANVNAKDAVQKLAIHYAIENNDTNITKLLLTHTVSVNVTMELLNTAVRKESREIVELLLNIAPKFNINGTDRVGRTALHHTVLDKGWDWDLGSPTKKGATDKESVDPRAEIAQMFINRGACVNAKTNNGDTALHMAAEGGYTKVVEILLANKANVNAQGEHNTTPLHLAAKRNNPILVQMLIDSGANVNAKQDNGTTALHIACKNGHDDLVKLLVERNANLDSVDKDKSLPLHLAAANDYCEVVEIILTLGSYVDAKNNLGRTALHLAAKHGFPSVADVLLDHGADVNVMCNDAMTPLDYATLGTTEYNNCNGDGLFPDRFEYDFDEEDFFDQYSDEADVFSDPDYDDYFDYFNGDDDSISDCPCEDVAEILEQHIIALMALGLYVSEKNLKAIDLEDEHRDRFEDCQTEITDMKSQKIANSNVTFYDVLTKNMNQLVIYTRNENIVEALKPQNLSGPFPTYSSMFARRIRLGQKRNDLLCSSLKSLAALSGYILPDLSAIELFNYLSNKDLENLINADPSDDDNDS